MRFARAYREHHVGKWPPQPIINGNEPCDDPLCCVDFFEVEKYDNELPLHGIRDTGDSWVIDRALTLHSLSPQVPLAVELNGFRPDPRRRAARRLVRGHANTESLMAAIGMPRGVTRRCRH